MYGIFSQIVIAMKVITETSLPACAIAAFLHNVRIDDKNNLISVSVFNMETDPGNEVVIHIFDQNCLQIVIFIRKDGLKVFLIFVTIIVILQVVRHTVVDLLYLPEKPDGIILWQ